MSVHELLRKVLVVVAPVGTNVHEDVKNPLSPHQVAAETVACAEAGAGMVHLHVRDSAGNQTADTTEFGKTLEMIREKSDIIIQGSTGGVSELSLEERCTALNESVVEVASLNMGSVNFDEGVYINTLPDIRYWAGRMRDAKVVPELEIFEAGMVNNVDILYREGVLRKPLTYSFCLGVKGALPATSDSVHFLRSIIPSGAAWGIVHHGMSNLSLLAAAIGMGASFVRVGFEDSVYLSPGRMAATNMDLVDNVVSLIRRMGMEIAAPGEARKLLRIGEE